MFPAQQFGSPMGGVGFGNQGFGMQMAGGGQQQMMMMQMMQMMQQMMGQMMGGMGGMGCGCPGMGGGFPGMGGDPFGGLGNQMGNGFGFPGGGFQGGGFPGGFSPPGVPFGGGFTPGGNFGGPGGNFGGPGNFGNVGNAPMAGPGNFGGPSAFGNRLASDAQQIAQSGVAGSGGNCKRGVRMALNRQGVNLDGLSAYQGADQLARNPRFREVQVPREQLRSLPPGAIVVWNRKPGKPHGHISIALGNGREASDVIRNQISNYGSQFRVFLPK